MAPASLARRALREERAAAQPRVERPGPGRQRLGAANRLREKDEVVGRRRWARRGCRPDERVGVGGEPRAQGRGRRLGPQAGEARDERAHARRRARGEALERLGRRRREAVSPCHGQREPLHVDAGAVERRVESGRRDRDPRRHRERGERALGGFGCAQPGADLLAARQARALEAVALGDLGAAGRAVAGLVLEPPERPARGAGHWRTRSVPSAASPSRRRHSSPATVSTPAARIDSARRPGDLNDVPTATGTGGTGSISWKNGSRSLEASRTALQPRRNVPSAVTQFASAKVGPRAASCSSNTRRPRRSRRGRRART